VACAALFTPGQRLGLLGIDLATRRRNRVNAAVRSLAHNTLTLDVLQSYGNCPKYIQVGRPQRVLHAPRWCCLQSIRQQWRWAFCSTQVTLPFSTACWKRPAGKARQRSTRPCRFSRECVASLNRSPLRRSASCACASRARPRPPRRPRRRPPARSARRRRRRWPRQTRSSSPPATARKVAPPAASRRARMPGWS